MGLFNSFSNSGIRLLSIFYFFIFLWSGFGHVLNLFLYN